MTSNVLVAVALPKLNVIELVPELPVFRYMCCPVRTKSVT